MAGYKEQIHEILFEERNYADPRFSAQRLAERLGVSACKLSRVLKTEFGKSYTSLVHAQRVQDAMRYLQDRRLAAYSIDDIGALVGFNNRQSFFSAFRQATGLTPERFRQSARPTIKPS